jgi:hypothetical protein
MLEDICSQVVNYTPDKLVDPQVRLDMLAQLRARWREVKETTNAAKCVADRMRSVGQTSLRAVRPLHRSAATLLAQSERAQVANPAKAESTLVKAGKEAILRNLQAQKALDAKAKFERARVVGAASLREQQVLESVMMHLMRGVQGKASVLPSRDAEWIKGQLALAEQLKTLRVQAANTPATPVVPEPMSAERNDKITDHLRIRIITPGLVAANPPPPAQLPSENNEPKYGMPMQPVVSYNPLDALASAIGVPGASKVAYTPVMLDRTTSESKAVSPPPQEVAHDGMVPRMLNSSSLPNRQLSNMWRVTRPLVRAALPARMQSPVAPTGPQSLFDRTQSPVRAPLQTVDDPYQRPDTADAGLAGLLGTLGERINTTTTAKQGKAGGDTVQGGGGDVCDWACQLQRALAQIGPGVGGALIGAGGATASQGDVAGGTALGLVGSALAFFGNFFGGPAKMPPALPAQQAASDDTILGIPKSVFLIGGLAVGVVGVAFVAKKRTA